jgi:hypothetical protein
MIPLIVRQPLTVATNIIYLIVAAIAFMSATVVGTFLGLYAVFSVLAASTWAGGEHLYWLFMLLMIPCVLLVLYAEHVPVSMRVTVGALAVIGLLSMGLKGGVIESLVMCVLLLLLIMLRDAGESSDFFKKHRDGIHALWHLGTGSTLLYWTMWVLRHWSTAGA